MKKQFNYFLSLVVGAALTLFPSCTPDDNEMPGKTIAPEDLVEGIAFTVTHDNDNPNIIHLQSLMPSQYTVAWKHPQGNATATNCDLKIPFAGEYEVQFGVNTRAGLVWSEPVTFTVDDMCEDFIKGELWSIITGGVGKSKTWVLDLDENGKTYSMFASPIWYFNTGYTWDMLHNAKGENYIDSNPWDPATAINTNFPLNSDGAAWYWQADYAGNLWMCTAADYGTFTFDLIGGANLTTNNQFDGEKKGLFMINEDTRTMKLSGISFYPIDSRVADCYDFDILYATEDFLQLLCHTGDGNTSVCLNFTSKNYRDNWQEPVQVGLPTGWFEVFSYQNIFGTYQLSSDDSYDYFALDDAKTRQNRGGSIDETEGFTLKFECPTVDKVSNKGSYIATTPDETIDGSFTADSLGFINLAKGMGRVEIAPEVSYEGSDLEVLDVTLEDGKITDIWLGRKLYDFTGKAYQYIGYHYVAVLGGAPQAETFKAYAQFFETDGWSISDSYSDYVKCEDGKPATITFENFNMTSFSHLGLYVGVEKVYTKYPNCDVIINSISVDGTPVSIEDQTLFGYSVEGKDLSDNPSVRRTILNAWAWDGDTDNNVIPTTSFKCTSTLSVTFTVVFDSGEQHFGKTE